MAVQSLPSAQSAERPFSCLGHTTRMEGNAGRKVGPEAPLRWVAK